MQPNWSGGQPSYNVTSQIPIRFNLTSDCSADIATEANISGASTTLKLLSPSGTWTSTYNPNNETGQGRYNYTWNSTGQAEGNWSIQINSSKSYFLSNSTFLTDWFWLENLQPQNQTTPAVAPASDGWTRWFNYSVSLTDPENDTTNCTLWISTNNQGTWTNNGTYTLASGNGVCYVVIRNFNQSDVDLSSGYDQNNYFRFTVSDIESNNTYNTSIISGPILEPSNITIAHMLGNNSKVNISSDSSKYTTFILRLNDTDNQTKPIPMNLTFWIQLNSTNWDWGNTTITNSTGYANYNFAPNCSYEPGIRLWYAQATDTYYEQKRTENFTVQINGTLTNHLLSPLGAKVLRGSNMTLQVRVNDTCGNNITDMSVSNITIRMVSLKTSQTFYCNGTANVGDDLYNCTLQ